MIQMDFILEGPKDNIEEIIKHPDVGLMLKLDQYMPSLFKDSFNL